MQNIEGLTLERLHKQYGEAKWRKMVQLLNMSPDVLVAFARRSGLFLGTFLGGNKIFLEAEIVRIDQRELLFAALIRIKYFKKNLVHVYDIL